MPITILHDTWHILDRILLQNCILWPKKIDSFSSDTRNSDTRNSDTRSSDTRNSDTRNTSSETTAVHGTNCMNHNTRGVSTRVDE